MRLFDLPQAKYFCAPSDATLARVGRQALSSFHATPTRGSSLLEEGTTAFQVHQVNVVESVDRWLVYALAHYRRAVDMLVPVSAPWAQVTLYYSSFFSANAILGMFGGWMGHTSLGNRLVDVERGAIGNQALRIQRRFRSPTGGAGSHTMFWAVFYDATAQIAAWAPPEFKDALDPVNQDSAWQIAERNNVNYDMFHAWVASKQMHATLNPAKLETLSGSLRLQLEAAERLLGLALHFAKALAVRSTALNGCGPAGARTEIQRRLVTQRAPSMVTQSQLAALFDA
ncbi:MAG TPA: hypothetical protein VHE78_01325 [Gemmatimonadaceae bacterium]|nr:hypothetical protein [Gemmatimonadaceae bacterium]